MQDSRKRKFSEVKVSEERYARRLIPQSGDDKRKEAPARTSEILNEANLSSNLDDIAQLIPPMVAPIPSYPTTGVRVRLNLPKLLIPNVLPDIEEVAITNLQAVLLYNNFVILDRTTLAFFAIGMELDVRAAAQCFVNFYNLANCAEFKSPCRVRMEAMEEDGLIEGFAWHKDGTFGPLVNIQKWNVANHTAAYIVRESLCYTFHMVDLSHLRMGTTEVFNVRNLTWRTFAPFEIAKITAMLKGVLPVQFRKRIYIDPGWYFLVADSVLSPLLPDSVNKSTAVLSIDDVRHAYPLVELPKSLTGMTDNTQIVQLSTERQLDFRFFLDA
jgi:hypothetical protein